MVLKQVYILHICMLQMNVILYLKKIFIIILFLRILDINCLLTLKAPRKPASENVVCLCRLLNILANFSNLFFAYQQTVWTQIRLLLKEQSDLGPHCLQK